MRSLITQFHSNGLIELDLISAMFCAPHMCTMKSYVFFEDYLGPGYLVRNTASRFRVHEIKRKRKLTKIR